MKKLTIIIALLGVVYFAVTRNDRVEISRTNDVLAKAFEDGSSNVQVEGGGRVTRILSDDLTGGRHQRFIITLDSGQTLLVAHNIDLAPRIDALRSGDDIVFNGEYEWNSQGGVLHWTHRDPSGKHTPGWIKHGGRTYQ